MALVVGGFKCPYTKRIYRVGEKYTGEHVEEFTRKGYLEAGTSIDASDIGSMTKKEIIEYAKSKGIELDERMTKKEMIKELV